MNPVNLNVDPNMIRSNQIQSGSDSITPTQRQTDAFPALTSSRQSGPDAASGSNVRVLTPPSDNAGFNAPELSTKLTGTNHGADVFKIMEAIHKLFLEMRRQAAESKQDAYLSQWTALEAKAEEIKSAARKDLAASMVNGAMGVVGGVIGMKAGYSAMKQTHKAMNLDVTTPKLGQTKPDTLLSQKSLDLDAPASMKKTGQTANGSTPPAASTSGKPVPEKSNTNTDTDAPDTQTKPASGTSAENPQTANGSKSKDQADAPTNGNQNMSAQEQRQMLLGQSQNYSNMGMVVSQFFTGMGTLVSAPVTFTAELDRAQSQEQEAEATKAQADVKSETEFVRSASEGAKAIQDFLDQFINSQAQVNSKIMA
ncbi:hypothetical protein [Hahella ganghwensis]|uniref:hypothetical protein n=1 Tax=Hahella ganghwensis TaxID=286420 RepID=UPI00037539F1|nr:hypothetical protein [Hahella ganghwensis]